MWGRLATEAAVALMPMAESIVDVEQANERTRAYAAEVLAACGLAETGGAATSTRGASEPARVRRVRSQPVRRAPLAPSESQAVPASTPPTPHAGATYDFVGIVMAKSAEGDAVASILGRRDGVEVIEQPAFWDIRAKDRLSIPYREVSEQLGYEIDAYSIQHEMSTHYGRMITTDDALMLFSDPTEAMSYLMS